ncbi:MAG: SidJ-related pseudokinase [Desulfococcaceae bacterium]
MTTEEESGERGLARLEADLLRPGRDMSGAYMAVGRLRELLAQRPEAARPETAEALAGVWRAEFGRQRQAYFLFRAAADLLADLAAAPKGDGTGERAMVRLRQALAAAEGPAHRAAAEALGGLPLAIPRPPDVPEWDGNAVDVRWDDLLTTRGLVPGGPSVVLGRSVTVPIRDTDWRLLVKLARTPADGEALNREAIWAERLRPIAGELPVRFDVPRPLRVRGRRVMRVRGLPLLPPGIRRDAAAIVLVAPGDYFVYPNEPGNGGRFRTESFVEVMTRNARILGTLAGEGVLHTAPIPLFHNRVQQDRRDDHGLYEWWRGGRLDQWLASCRYPNFGASGLRDLEHLEPADGGFYRAIGAHLLSLLLVTGSHFRNRAPERVGLDSSGAPADARDFFDRDAVRRTLEGVFREYFAGFVGRPFSEDFPLDLSALADRMVEEMGVDRHMEEVLRLPDQERMSDADFRAFLASRGMSPREALRPKRGEGEIVLRTGPHLGDFNGRISLPEMIRFLETASALCVAGRFVESLASGQD